MILRPFYFRILKKSAFLKDTLYDLYIVHVTCFILHDGGLCQQKILICKIHIENAEWKSSHKISI